MWGKRKGTIALVVILGLVLALLLACAGGEKEATPTSAAGGTPAAKVEEPIYGGTLRYNIGFDVTHWDFQKTVGYQTMSHSSFVHGKLLTFPFGPDEDPADFTPRASLAESWEMPNDTTIIFHLRKGVKWQNKPPVNGREFVAEDVKYTFERLVKIKSPNLGLFAAIKSIDCPDKYTVQMNLSEPFAPLFTNLADVWAWIFPHEVDEQFGGMEKAENVVGLGPWMMKSYQPAVGTVFVRNPDYWEKDKQGRQLPFVEEVRLSQVADASTSLAAIRAGNFDVTLSISRENWDSVRASNPELVWTKDWVDIGMTYMYFNLSQPPFNDVRVRRAVSLAYDRDTWVATIQYGAGARDNGPVPVGQKVWHIPEDQLGDAGQWLKYDPDKAKKLLAEAGYPNGFSIDFNTTGGYGTTLVENGELVMDMLAKVGIKCTMKQKEYGAYLSTTYVGNFDGIAWGPQSTFIDPDPYLYEMYHTKGSKNQLHLSNPDLDKMLEAQRKEYDLAKRKQIIWDISKYIVDQAYRVYVPRAFGRGAYHPWVHNYGIKMGGYDYGQRFLKIWVDQTSPAWKK